MRQQVLSEAILEAIEIPLVVFDDERVVRLSNAAADELFGFAPDELVGSPLETLIDVERAGDLEQRWSRAVAGDGEAGGDGAFVDRDGEVLEMAYVFYPRIAEQRHLLVIRDVPGRPLREAELSIRSQLLDKVDAAVIIVGLDRRIVEWNAGAQRLYGWPRAVAIGRTADELGLVVVDDELGLVVDAEGRLEADRARGRLEAGGSSRVQLDVRRRDGTRVPIEARGSAIRSADGSVVQYAYVVVDVSDRLEREGNLRRRAQMHEVTAELAQQALAGAPIEALTEHACERITEVLDVPFIKVLELDPDAQELILRAGIGWEQDQIGRPHVSAGDSHSGFAIASQEPVVVDDLDLEWRFHATKVLRRQGIRSGIAVTIPGPDGPYGALTVHHTEPRHFNSHQAAFLESIAKVLGAALGRDSGALSG